MSDYISGPVPCRAPRRPLRILYFLKETDAEGPIDEKELITRILSGQRDEYASLVRAHQAQVYQLCLAFLADPHEAEEAAQVVFIKAFHALGRFQGQSTFRTWVTRIGINHCKDRLKSRRRSKTVSLETMLEDGTSLPPALICRSDPAPEPLPLPEEAFDRLSPGEREVLMRAGEREDIDYAALGREMGLTRDGVKGRLKRARQKVKAFLKRSAKSRVGRKGGSHVA